MAELVQAPRRVRLPVNESVTTRAYQFYAFPVAIIEANDPRQVNWTLTNFIHLAYDTRPRTPVPMCFYIFDYAINPHLETIRTDSELMHDLLGSRLAGFAAERIADGWYLYLNVDEHHIPHRYAHGRKRMSHDLLVHGFDADTGTIDVLGYDDTPTFRSVTIPAAALDASFAAHRELNSPCRQFVLYRYREGSTFDFDREFVAEEIRTYLRSENPTAALRAVREPWDRVYGLAVWRCFADELAASRAGEREYDNRSARVMYEHAHLMHDRIRYMLADDPSTAEDAAREYRPVVRYCRSLGYAVLAAGIMSGPCDGRDAIVTLLRTNGRFRVLWLVNLVSSMVGWSLGIALAVHVYLLTESALLTSVLAATSTVAGIAFGAVAGVTADRYDRLRIVQSALAIRVVLLIGLFGVAESSAGLVAIVFVQATVQQFYGPAEQVLIASYVDADELSDANGLNSFASNATRLIDPAMGGFVIAWAGFRWTVLGMSVLMTVSFLLSVTLSRHRADRARSGEPDGQEQLGVRPLLRANPRACGLVLLQLLDAVKEGPLSALFPVLMLGVIGATSGEMGLANSAFAVTAIIAGPLVGVTVRRLGYRLPVIAGAAVSNLLIVVLAIWPSTAMALVAFLLSGLPFTLSWVGTQTWLLLSVPDKVRGRVVGTAGALYASVLLATMLGAGVLAEAVGVRWVLDVTAALAFAGLVVVDRLVRSPAETPAMA